MIEASFPKPKVWLDIRLCEIIYKDYKTLLESQPENEPLPDFEKRYSGVLEGILESVKLKSDKLDFDAVETAATYYVHLTKSQALFNGNKRMGIVFTNVFLYLNDLRLNVSKDLLKDLSILIAENNTVPIDEIETLMMGIFRNRVEKHQRGK